MPAETDILVIDDEQIVLDAVKHICTSEGMTVQTARDGPGGVRLIGAERFRVILCDIMMPDTDGFQVLAEAQRIAPATPVIISTGFATVENAVRSLYAGAIDFVPKPFTADELLSTVRRGLRYRDLVSLGDVRGGGPGGGGSFAVPCPPRYYRLGYMSWTIVESDGTALIGVSHAFSRTVEQISRLDFVSEQEDIVQGIRCAGIETGDGMVHAVLSPLSGTVIARNTEPAANPHIVEKDPYFAGWLYRIIPSHLEYELSHLTPCGSDTI
jgi:CheY-like chemotaxis protein/glycine cleavage system H lipoate-binding protein